MRLGVIADTHGLIRPEAVAALRGVDHILHAGDIGSNLSSRAPKSARDPLRICAGDPSPSSRLRMTDDGVRFFNPASAGPRRFDFPVSVGILEARRALHIALDWRSKPALQKRMNQLSSRA